MAANWTLVQLNRAGTRIAIRGLKKLERFSGDFESPSVKIALLSSHPPVVGARYPIGESRVRSLRTARAHLDPDAAIGLSLQVDGYLVLVSRTSNYSASSVCRGHPHTFILGCA